MFCLIFCKWLLGKERHPLHLPKSDLIDPDSLPERLGKRYTNVIAPRKLLPERNVVVYYTEFDEFKEELERRHWDEELTDFIDNNINVAIVKEFYANLYDPEDKSPK